MGRKANSKRKNNKGFSLVELIIVIAIMAILVGVLAPQFVKYLNKSKTATDIQNAQNIASAVAAQWSEDQTVTTKTMAGAYENDGVTIDNVQVDGTGADSTAIQGVVGGKPAVKAKNGYHFYVSVTNKGVVTVNVSNGTDTVELYPEVEAGSDWEK